MARIARETSCKSWMEAGSRPVGREQSNGTWPLHRYGHPVGVGLRGRVLIGADFRIVGAAMSADIIQFRDYQQPKDLARLYSETTLEQQAIEIFNVALIGPGGIDDLLSADTAPCEMNPDDPA